MALIFVGPPKAYTAMTKDEIKQVGTKVRELAKARGVKLSIDDPEQFEKRKAARKAAKNSKSTFSNSMTLNGSIN